MPPASPPPRSPTGSVPTAADGGRDRSSVDSTLVSDAPGSVPPEISPETVEAAVLAALSAFTDADDSAALKVARAAHMGDGSPLAKLNALLRDVAPERKAEFGKLIGQSRGRVAQALAARETELEAAELAARLEAESVDITALPVRAQVGARHPLTLLQEEISDVFVGMGWEVAEGPELEHEWFNFDA
ncbi:MAG TPA: hypothetical protein DEA59_04180, partial [Microbacterium sp.]|nr:hypothetical protein [Microbacterium sp.]HBR88448.1 hypothetical protein [Microbacterium sp.]